MEPRAILMVTIMLLASGIVELHPDDEVGTGLSPDAQDPRPSGDPAARSPSITEVLATGQFVENVGQRPVTWGTMYIDGHTTSAAFGTGWFDYILHDARGDGDRVVHVELSGARSVAPAGVGPEPSRINYIMGRDPGGWIKGARGYTSIYYESAWDDIDLVFRSEGDRLKYDLVLGAGADPSIIGFAFGDGVELEVEESSGDLLIRVGHWTLRDSAPTAYQCDGDGGRVDVRSGFSLRGASTVTFELSGHDTDLPVVIDPGIEFGSYFGGTDDDEVHDVEIDQEGNVYIAGNTASSDLPTSGAAYQGSLAGYIDGFIAKLDGGASRLLFCTYFGGTNLDYFRDIELNGDGTIIGIGTTHSSDLPITPGAFCSTRCGAEDGFLARFSAEGDDLLYSTFLGGPEDDTLRALELTGDGSAYLVAVTQSRNMTTTEGAFCETFSGGATDLVVMRFSLSPVRLIFSTFLGGSDSEGAGADCLAIGGTGEVYVVGSTWSDDFPTTAGAYCQTHRWSSDAFIAKLSPDGADLLACTLVGGTAEDSLNAIAQAPDGDLWCGGTTGGSDLVATPDAFQAMNRGGWECMIARLPADLTSLDYLSYYGTPLSEYLESIEMGSDGEVYMGGTCDGSMPAPRNAPILYEGYPSGNRMFLAWLDPASGKLQNCSFSGPYSTSYYGTSGFAVAPNGTLVVGTMAKWNDIKTTKGVLHEARIGGDDGAVVGVTMGPTPWRSPGPPEGVGVTGLGDWMLSIGRPTDDGGWPLWNFSIYVGPERGRETLYKSVDPYVSGIGLNLSSYPMYEPVYIKVTCLNYVGEGPPAELVFYPFVPPSPPLNLTANDVRGTVHLEWDPPESDGGRPIAGYYLFKTLRPGSSGSYIRLDGTETAYTDEDVHFGARYYYRIRAFHQFGNGSFSDYVDVTVHGSPDETRLYSVEESGGDITLTWREPSNPGGSPVTGYNIYRGLSVDGLELVGKVGYLDPVQDYVDVGPPKAVRLYYGVRAYNEFGLGTMSRIFNITIFTRPGPPLNLTAAPSHLRVTLRWDRPESDGGMPSLSYRVYRGRTPDQLATIGTVDSTTYIDLAVENDVGYHYQVTAINGVGEGSPSALAFAVPTGVPSAPMDLRIVEGNRLLTLQWNAPEEEGATPIEFYRVLRGIEPGTLEALLEVPASTLVLGDDRVTVGQVYFYCIVAVNQAGGGARSDLVSGTPWGVPREPLNLAATVGDGMVNLTWEPPASDGGRSISLYTVYRWREGSTPSTFLVAATATWYEDSDVVNGVTYVYAVSASNVAGEGPRFLTITATPRAPPTVPGEPQGLVAKAVGGEMLLTWKAPVSDGGSSILGYIVYRGNGTDDMVLLAVVGDVLEYRDSDIKRGKVYEYRVAGVNALGEGEPSPVAEGKVKPEDGGIPGFTATISVPVVMLAAIVACSRGRRRHPRGG